MDQSLEAIEAKKKSGKESFRNENRNLSFNLIDFWKWYASDLKSNRMKGILAEFLVARALESTNSVRIEWDAYDVITDGGLKIEVKAASYIQSWHQHNFSKIRFNISPTKTWNAQTGKYSKNKARTADIYVFCLLNHKDQKTLDPLDLSQWTFFVISTEQLNDQVGQQKSIGLSSLRDIGTEEVKFRNLKHAVNSAAS